MSRCFAHVRKPWLKGWSSWAQVPQPGRAEPVLRCWARVLLTTSAFKPVKDQNFQRKCLLHEAFSPAPPPSISLPVETSSPYAEHSEKCVGSSGGLLMVYRVIVTLVHSLSPCEAVSLLRKGPKANSLEPSQGRSTESHKPRGSVTLKAIHAPLACFVGQSRPLGQEQAAGFHL